MSLGSVGRALSINVEQLRAQREKMLAVVANVIETGDRAALLRTAESMNDAKNKDAFEQNLDILQSLVRDVWALRQGADADSIINTDVVERLQQLAITSGTFDME